MPHLTYWKSQNGYLCYLSSSVPHCVEDCLVSTMLAQSWLVYRAHVFIDIFITLPFFYQHTCQAAQSILHNYVCIMVHMLSINVKNDSYPIALIRRWIEGKWQGRKILRCQTREGIQTCWRRGEALLLLVSTMTRHTQLYLPTLCLG